MATHGTDGKYKRTWAANSGVVLKSLMVALSPCMDVQLKSCMAPTIPTYANECNVGATWRQPVRISMKCAAQPGWNECMCVHLRSCVASTRCAYACVCTT